MTLSDIQNHITFLTGADTNAYTNANRVISLNKYFNKIVYTMIFAAQDEWDWDDSSITATYPVAKRNLVASQRDYKFTTAASSWTLIGVEGSAAASSAAITPLKIKRLDVTYDGTTWYKAEPFDINEMGYGDGNDTTVDARFSKSEPKYDTRDNAVWLYPTASTADVTAGAKMKIQFVRQFTEYTSSDLTTGTATPPIDRAFHTMLALGPAYDFAVAKNLASKNDLAGQLGEYEARLKQYYGDKQEDRNTILSSAFIDYE